MIAMDTKTNLTQEWLDKYESVKDKLQCKVDLDEYFTKSKVANMDVAILDLGQAHFPTGQIIACDPFIELEDCEPFIQTIAPGTYSVQLCVVPHQKYGNRYACAKLKISDAKAVRYEMAMTGKENLNEEIGEGEYFGFGVDAGMGCFADVAAQKAFKKVWESMLEEIPILIRTMISLTICFVKTPSSILTISKAMASGLITLSQIARPPL